ncbi:DIL domain-domain-containing protein [Absidia repens]|uniref:DIL domain-domain-containing protein n=1 Tax=Absidia repens TaxID=90262 RepID=A0A1X2I8U0_9FUNG|nr:DIL domain-domain-containing protein [Absidia repens]
MILINDTNRRIEKVLGPAMLEHDEIPGMDQVKFTDDWQRFFRRNSRRSMVVPSGGALATQIKRQTSQPTNAINTTTTSVTTDSAGTATKTSINNSNVSPESITSLLSSTLFVLQSYDVHPAIVIQALAQFFHYMSCELFNRILTNKKLLCRSKAMQIRMNVSQLEDWISTNNMPASLSSYMTPITQLLQLLQCLTQLTDLVSFINTAKAFDVLNALQVKRCVTNYRYEVNEPRLPEEIEKYAMQLAEDTVRHQQARNYRRKDSLSSIRTTASLPQKRPMLRSMSRSSQQSITMQRTNSSRRESMSHLVGSLMSSMRSAHPRIRHHRNSSSQMMNVTMMNGLLHPSTWISQRTRSSYATTAMMMMMTTMVMTVTIRTWRKRRIRNSCYHFPYQPQHPVIIINNNNNNSIQSMNIWSKNVYLYL